MEKHILLPTDFSDNAWSATVYALKLYEHETCTFYFLHSTKMKVSTMSNMSNKLLEIMAKNTEDELNELKEMAVTANANANHNFKIINSTQALKEAIETTIRRHKINLVVMGTKGATGAKEFFFGSNTVRIIKKIKGCPVLIVPNEFDFVTPKEIAFPTDFNRFYSEEELRALKNLSELYNSKIRIVNIKENEEFNDIQDYNMIKLKEYLKNYDNSFHSMPDYAKKEVEINDFIQDMNINILAMVNYKHSFIENIIKEPVIKKIGFHPTIPFLVIPE